MCDKKDTWNETVEDEVKVVVDAQFLDSEKLIGLPHNCFLVLTGVNVLCPSHVKKMNNVFRLKCDCTTMLPFCFQDCSSIAVTLPFLQVVSERPFAWSLLTEISLHRIAKLPSFSFFSCRSLERLYLPNLLAGGDSVFRNCVVLSTICVPKLQILGAFAFAGCEMLQEVQVPELVNCGVSCFAECANLRDVDLSRLCAVSSDMFERCTRLDNLHLPEATIIDEDACIRCENLTSVNAPKICTIRNSAFMGCARLHKLHVPSVRTIEANACYGCAIKQLHFYNLIYLGRSAFGKNIRLGKVTLPLLQFVSRAAFAKCVLLRSVMVPEVTTIESNAFLGCAFLKNDNCQFPDTLRFIGKNAFKDTNFDKILTPLRCYADPNAFGKDRIATPVVNILKHRYFFRKTAKTRLLTPQQRHFILSMFCMFQKLLDNAAFHGCPIEIYLLCLSFVDFESMML